MDVIDILPLSIYKFECNEVLTERIFNEISSLTFKQNLTNKTAVREKYKFNIPFYFDEELYDWFDNCINEVSAMHFSPRSKLVITDCWVNKTNWLESHYKHYHGNSILSGVFYISPADMSEICFYGENLWTKNAQHFMGPNFDHSKQISTKIKPSASTLLLFPSHLMHEVLPNKNKAPRFSIAFNTYFDGEFGEVNQSTYIKIKSESVRDRIKNEINSSM